MEQPVPKSLPKTAEELRALVEPHLARLPPKDQRRFLMLMTDDPRNIRHQEFLELVKKVVDKLCGYAANATELLVTEMHELLAKLKKHRRPTKNAERDAVIMGLHREGKTAGQIVLALGSRWELSDRMVTAVISRERRREEADQE